MPIVPQIGLGCFLHGDDEDRLVARKTDERCREIGFLTVVGHGVSDD